MARRGVKLFGFLLKSSWWVSVIQALVVFVEMRWIALAEIGATQIGRGVGMAVAKMAPWPAAFFLMLAAGSAIFAAKKRKLVDGQTSLESLRNVSWKHFEWMVGEAYLRMGYAVEESLRRNILIRVVFERDRQRRTLSVDTHVTRVVGGT
jgi:restriction system protein